MRPERSEASVYSSAQEALARGFAAHVFRWTGRCGAANDVLEAVSASALDLSLATSSGHVCCDLRRTAERLKRPALVLRRQLLDSGLVGTPDACHACLMVVDADNRLYLRRYFDYEQRLARRLLRALHAPRRPLGLQSKALLDRLFSALHPATARRAEGQKLAAALALEQAVTVVSGGPGTGKTTTVAKILACILADEPHCRIRLCAPTAKAAARMLEALRGAAAELPEDVQPLLPTESLTVHRLLGFRADARGFRHHAENLLALDVLVVDEASMLDLALAVKLFEALPDGARIILLGDKDQLAAVEAGAVFSILSANPGFSADCIARLSAITAIPAERIRKQAPGSPGVMADCAVWLSESFRFDSHSVLGRFASHVRAGEARAAIELLQDAKDAALEWIDAEAGAELPAAVLERLLEGMRPYLEQLRTDPANTPALFEALGAFRVLCAVREGTRGVAHLNRRLSRAFRDALAHPLDPGIHAPWFPGRVVMVLKNDYLLRLFNGDLGIALPDSTGTLRVIFPDRGDGFRLIAPGRLPEHETAFATTVHKAQGSEFSRIALILPARSHRVLRRELLYTAITRARRGILILGSEAVLREAVESPTERLSGLFARLQDTQRAEIRVEETA